MNLLNITDTQLVEKTTLTRKITIGGVTKAYPVYKVRLDQLFYNDQNDRIATWITQYKNDVNSVDFSSLERDEYNNIIGKFIIESNPAAIEKTKNNIMLVNQREPGVALSDGRIIDGNRRFTCLRLLNAEDSSFNYFETVILDENEGVTQKQIKMLELSIQHGEESKVSYNLIDLALGAYHDIVETELLTIDEYVSSTNESLSDVRRRLETAKLIIEFLEYMKVPGQYHIAREMQIYSVFYELVPLLKRCETEDAVKQLKESVFNNVMMGAFADHRKYIRKVKEMMDSGLFLSYMKKQNKINEELSERLENVEIKNKHDLQSFIKSNEDITEDLQISMDRSVLQAKKAQTKSRPTQLVSKSISMLMDVDTRIVETLTDEEKEKLSGQLEKLSGVASLLKAEVGDENPTEVITKVEEPASKKLLLAERNLSDPLIYVVDANKTLTNMAFTLTFSAVKCCDYQDREADRLVFFVDENHDDLSDAQLIHLVDGETTKVSFSLNSSASELKECYLVIKLPTDDFDKAQQLIKFKLNISFSVGFDF